MLGRAVFGKVEEVVERHFPLEQFDVYRTTANMG